ncbi:hypothetical protein J7M28_00925, partial [bacterium]|nr:hypothetical protein [bacterium]
MKRSPLVALLLLVGFAVISVTVWNLSGCSKGGGDGDSKTGPEGVDLTLSAYPSQTPVFRTIEITATLKDAYNMALADQSVQFVLIQVIQATSKAASLKGIAGGSVVQPFAIERNSSIGARRASPMTPNNRPVESREVVSGKPGFLNLDPMNPVITRPELNNRVQDREIGKFLPAEAMRMPLPLADSDIDLDDFQAGATVVEVFTDSMGVASCVVTSESLNGYMLRASSGGANSNAVTINFVANPMYRCTLQLTTDKTTAYADAISTDDSFVTATAKLLYSGEPVVGELLEFSGSSTTSGPSASLKFDKDISSGTTNSSGEVTVRACSQEMGTFNLCVNTDYECPSGTEMEDSDACKYVDFKARPANICELELIVDPNTALADGKDEILATATLLVNSEPLVNAQVKFSLEYDRSDTNKTVYFADTNTETLTSYTDEEGKVAAGVLSDAFKGQCEIIATAQEPCEGTTDEFASDSKFVTFQTNICKLELTVNPNTALADGLDEIQATALLTMNSEPLANKQIDFKIDLLGSEPTLTRQVYFAETGKSTASVYTGADGKVVVNISSFGFDDSCRIDAKATEVCPGTEDHAADSKLMTFRRNECSLTFTVDKANARSDGQPESQIEATGELVLNNAPVASKRIELRLLDANDEQFQGGYFAPSDQPAIDLMTDENGRITFKFGSKQTGTCRLVGTVAGFKCPGDDEPLKSDEIQVKFSDNLCQLALKAEPDVADATGEPVTITGTLSINGNPAGAGVEVVFTAKCTEGNLFASTVAFESTGNDTAKAYSDENGVVSVILASSGYYGPCTINAQTSQLCVGQETNDNAYVSFKPNVCEVAITPDKTVARADGSDSIALSITANVNGEPLVKPGISVALSTDLLGATFIESSSNEFVAVTGADGIATANLTSSGGVGVCTIQGVADRKCPGTDSFIKGAAALAFKSNVCLITVNAPSTAKCDGTEVTATAMLTMNDEPVPGEKVVFVIDLDGATFTGSGQQQFEANTDGSGVASATFSSDGATGLCMIGATASEYVCPGDDPQNHPAGEGEILFEESDCDLSLVINPMLAKA